MFDRPALLALLLSTVAGLSTLLGAVIVAFTKSKNEKLISVSLGFAAGVMVSVSFTDLYPTAVSLFTEHLGNHKTAIAVTVGFLIAGMLIVHFLDTFVPHEELSAAQGDKPHKDLYRVGIISMLAIGLHNLPEGVATFMAGYDNLTLGISITIAIALHNIPEGIAVALPIYYASGSRKKAFLYTFYSGIAEPIGALLTFLILRPFINPFLMGAVFAIISGIMIHIAVEELIPSSRQYGYERMALVATLIGICLMPLTHAL